MGSSVGLDDELGGWAAVRVVVFHEVDLCTGLVRSVDHRVHVLLGVLLIRGVLPHKRLLGGAPRFGLPPKVLGRFGLALNLGSLRTALAPVGLAVLVSWRSLELIQSLQDLTHHGVEIVDTFLQSGIRMVLASRLTFRRRPSSARLGRR
jgi:hypothetical protein